MGKVSIHKRSNKALSLFSSAGIGELGLKKNSLHIIAANEVRSDRCRLYAENFPDAKMFAGDIWEKKDDIIHYCQDSLGEDELFLVYATPPCQGMSTNGVGKLNSEARLGNRSDDDQRNRLVIPAMDVICALSPRWVLFENVAGMQNTTIEVEGRHERVKILDYIAERLGDDYVGKGEVLSCAHYGIPQIRKRMITLFTRDKRGIDYFVSNGHTFFPEQERSKPITLREAIGNLPALDGLPGHNQNTDFHPLHYVNCLTGEKYWWVANTPEGETAFNNQCVNPKCRYSGNARHMDEVKDGRWKSNKKTPIYCEKCHELLPRPTLLDSKTGKRRLISGFHSAYRRMHWDEPSRTLTRNFPFEASDNKIHPDQNRVLSIYEALVIQTISEYKYQWSVAGKPVTRSLIAQAIGESVPPKLIDFIASKLIKVTEGKTGNG